MTGDVDGAVGAFSIVAPPDDRARAHVVARQRREVRFREALQRSAILVADPSEASGDRDSGKVRYFPALSLAVAGKQTAIAARLRFRDRVLSGLRSTTRAARACDRRSALPIWSIDKPGSQPMSLDAAAVSARAAKR